MPPSVTSASTELRDRRRCDSGHAALFPAPQPRLQPSGEVGPPSRRAILGHSDAHGLFLRDQHGHALSARESCVQDIALQHDIVVLEHEDDHGRPLGALGGMNRHSPGMDQFVQLVEGIRHALVLKAHDQRSLG